MERKIFDKIFFKDSGFRFRLSVLISRILKESMKNSKKIVMAMREKTDDEIIDDLKKNNTRQKNYDPNIIKTLSGRFMVTKEKLDMTKLKLTNYLDIGTGDGNMTIAIADAFDIKNIYGYDVLEYGNVRDKIKNVHIGPELPDYSVGFDLITIIQTLHHVLDQKNILEKVYKLLNPGGFLLIKEHNANSDSVRKLIEIEHLLFELVDTNTHHWSKDLYLKSSDEWTQLLTEIGFTFVETFMHENEITNSCWLLYHK